MEKLRHIKHLSKLVCKFMLIEETLVLKHETDQGVKQVDKGGKGHIDGIDISLRK